MANMLNQRTKAKLAGALRLLCRGGIVSFSSSHLIGLGLNRMSTATNERDLLKRAVAGDQAAQESLLLSYYEPLSKHVAQVFPTSLQAVMSTEDILQQTFINAMRDFEKFELRARLRSESDRA